MGRKRRRLDEQKGIVSEKNADNPRDVIEERLGLNGTVCMECNAKNPADADSCRKCNGKLREKASDYRNA